ncbi:MAG: bifunctional (p)ppGpp synthetase/guanosine-3',5'-bis(diphosphate) 3'-pyrophosphohydrolase [Candidatus Aminicenantes bacterium]|nr:MAG: bifunctional (p)ppGpp synthetase/guanosine-3',5'-bis(diphosphate) 3'-pyrophosphohydrolase [Candidatus Aminicenantes bacterium]
MIRFDDILEKASSLYSEKDITTLKKAYVFAARAHKGQIRRSGEPYLSHPLEVAMMLSEMKLDRVTLAAGLLHDVLEDTDVTAADLKKNFGKEIADLVEGVTKITRVQDTSPEARQAESIRKIILAMTDDLRVIFIKLADRVHNLKTLKFLPEDKQKQIAQETLEIYVPIANRLGMGRMKAELEDLSFRYVSSEEYFKMVSFVEPQKKKAEKEIKKIKKTLQDLMKENNISAEIFARIKRLYSIYNKMKHQNIDFDQVYDFMAIRIITDSVKNCYAALGIIHQNWPHFPHRFRDLISMPKPNLYQALHTTIITENKQTIEIQVRTQAMHNMAENGISAHWKYKEKSPRSIMKEDARLHWLREMVELYKEQKSPKEFLKNLKIHLIPEEIYVFTPKGKVVTLPTGASVLDFAFKIHSEIGLHAKEAIVNSKKTPLKTILKTGDIIEILTSSEKQPRRDWLNKAFTSRARYHIKHWFNQQDKIKNSAMGKKLWEKKIKEYKLPSPWLKKENLLKRLSEEIPFRLPDIDAFYALIGSGKVVLNNKFMEKLFQEEQLADKKETLLEKVVAKVAKRPKPLIEVKQADEAIINLAKCCAPIRGEPIIGYITSGKGMTVHAQRCALVKKEILNPQRFVDASWSSSSAEGSYQSKLLVKSQDSPGVLAKLTTAIAELGGNITKAQVDTFADQKAQIKLTIIIRDIKHLEQIVKKILGIKEVSFVERV